VTRTDPLMINLIHGAVVPQLRLFEARSAIVECVGQNS
jgi:hypothetical protein